MDNYDKNAQQSEEAILNELEALQPAPEDNDLIVPEYVPNVEENGLERPEEAQQRMAELPTMTEEEVLESICKLNPSGSYSMSDGLVEYTRIDNYLDKINDQGEIIGEITEDDLETVDERDVSNYKLRFYTSDGEHMVVEMEFYSPDDSYFEDLLTVIDEYNEALAAYLEGRTKDFPGLAISYIPHEAMGHYIVKMSSPIATIRSVNDDGDPNCLTLIFHTEDVEVNTYEYTLEEYNQMKDNAIRKEISKLDPEIQQQVSLGTIAGAMPIKVE